MSRVTLRPSRLSSMAVIAFSLSIIPAMAALACDQPPLPMLPSKDSVGRGEQDVLLDMQAYVDGMSRYVDCLDAEIDALGKDDSSGLARALLAQRHNAAVEEANAITQLFVERVGPVESVALGVVVHDDPVRCILMSQVRDTEVIDDGRVLFEGAGDRSYLNRLAANCTGLRSSGAFTYRARGTRNVHLCASDTITVVSPPNSSCRLGTFFEITKDQAEALKTSAITRR